MSVLVNHDKNVVTAKIQGDIDHHTAASIRTTIDENVERLRPKTLIIDFSEVSFMDSSGIGLIMGRYNTMKLLGGSLQVENPTPSIEKILRISGMPKLAKIVKTKEEVK